MKLRKIKILIYKEENVVYYYIITDNEKILEFAKENGAEVVEAPRSIVINVEKNDLKISPKVKITESENENSFNPKTIDEFLSAFPNLNMNRREVQYFKYILKRNVVGRRDVTRNVFARVATKFRVPQEFVRVGIMKVYRECITNVPKQYKDFFDQYECSVHWTNEYVLDFIKACQEYLAKSNIRI